ncbi:glycoside hydrolase family 9 protein [Candidatus Poribacteria bacterium]
MDQQSSFSRDLRVDIAVNQVGFVPSIPKKCVVPVQEETEFRVISLGSGDTVYKADLQISNGDFGRYGVGDFSAVGLPGKYYVKAGSSRSYPFRVGHDVYDHALQMIVGYFSLQRCGPSTTGYLAPCHMDDGVRLDNGKHQDVTGGWHDASDLRKWVGATIYGMIGLTRLYEVLNPAWDQGQVMDELRWGNRYFLSMQEPEGYVMSHVGGDVLKHSDSNRWTDNVIGEEGGSAVTISPAPGGTPADITIIGAKDDRVIQTNPLDRFGQYNFVIVEAAMARLTRQKDVEYSKECLTAASSCFDWCIRSGSDDNTGHLGVAMEAAIELYRTTGSDKYKEFAIDYARRLADLQVEKAIDPDIPIRGFYLTSAKNSEPYRNISRGCWHVIALCDLIEVFPEHTDLPKWREAVTLYACDYLQTMSQRSNFGIVPYGFYSADDPGGSRQIGKQWYRYFMRPEGWWVGVNANLASAGVGLVKAAKNLQDFRLLETAQRQLDWILGVNPFNSSTVEGIGHNHPRQFINSSEFKPATPRLPGAVMNGIGGTADDQPDLYDGSYHTAEYWTPMVGYTMWLMAELSNY